MFTVHPGKSFVPAFFKVYIEHLFDNLASGKRNYCFGKRSKNRSKNLYEPCMLDFWFIAIQSISIFNLRMYFLMVSSYRKNKCQARSCHVDVTPLLARFRVV